MKKILLFAVLFIAMYANASYAQLDRTKLPQPGPFPSLKLPAAQRMTLNNGLNIMLVEHHELPVVYMQMIIKTGADADPIGKIGIANMVSNMLDEGTMTMTSLQLADEIDFIGASITTNANYDASFVNLLTLKEHLERAMELYADVILRPSFPAIEFERIKKETLTNLLQQKDRPDIVATNVFYSRLYGTNHPYGYQISGTEVTVQAILLDDVYKFYRTYYVPNNASLTVVGNIVKEEVLRIVEKYFGSWEKSDIPLSFLPKPMSDVKTTIYLVDKPGATQSQIRIGNIAVPRNSADFYAVSILNQIIGASNGRLFLNLREAKGYTYGAYATFSMRKEEGPFLAYASVQTEVTDSSLNEFMYEFRRIGEELMTEEEFTMYKTAVIQRLPRVFETPAQIAGQLGGVVIYDLPDDYFDSLVENYNAVRREDILRVAKKYIRPHNLTIVIVGDKEKIKDKLQALNLGPVVYCDETGKEL